MTFICDGGWPHVNDRRIHADFPDGSVLVRYDRAGKWYQEWPPEAMKQRQQLSVRAAAATAKALATSIHFGLPGGTRFDKLAR